MAQFAIKDAGNIRMTSNATGKVLFYTRALNKFNFKVDSESVYAKAKGSNYIAFDGAITATITMEQEVITFPQLSLILASDMIEGNADISYNTIAKFDGARKITIPNVKFLSNSVSVYEVEEDNSTIGKEIKGTVVQSSNNLEFTAIDEVVEGTSAIVCYSVSKPNVKKIVVKDEASASNYRIDADIMVKTAEGKFMVLYATFFNCKAQRSIEFGLDAENPVNFQTTLDVLPNEKGEYVEFKFVEDEQQHEVMAMFEEAGIKSRKSK